MVLIHAKATGVHVLFGTAVHSIHNIWHIRSHAAGGGAFCDYGPFYLGSFHHLLSTWILGLVAARLDVLSAGSFK